MTYCPCHISQETPYDEFEALRTKYPDRSVYMRKSEILCPSRDTCKKVTSAVLERVERDFICNQTVQITTDLQTGQKRLTEGTESCYSWRDWRGFPPAPRPQLPHYPAPDNQYSPPRWPEGFSKSWS